MKMFKKVMCWTVIVLLRTIELPVTLVSFIAQVFELCYLWCAVKIAELSGSPALVAVMNAGLEVNAEFIGDLKDYIEDLHIEEDEDEDEEDEEEF